MSLVVWCQGQLKGYFITAQYLLIRALFPSISSKNELPGFCKLKCTLRTAFVFIPLFQKHEINYVKLCICVCVCFVLVHFFSLANLNFTYLPFSLQWIHFQKHLIFIYHALFISLSRRTC